MRNPTLPRQLQNHSCTTFVQRLAILRDVVPRHHARSAVGHESVAYVYS